MADTDESLEAERRFDAQYEVVGEPLGEGTFGKVLKARASRTGEYVALKHMKLEHEVEGVPSTAMREIALLKVLSHPNVVRLLDLFCKRNKLVLVFEFVENDLKKYMKSQNSRLSPNMVRSFAYQLCRGIDACHANRILHRDIKPQNLLVDNQLCLKIADFGLARAFTMPVPEYTHEVVTVWYRPPEILLGGKLYSLPVDLWSVGCVHAEMATGAPLFPGDSEIDTIFKIFQKFGTPSEAIWPGLSELPDFKPSFPKWPRRAWEKIRNTKAQVGADGVDLLEKLMAYDPKKRLLARQALQHPYFSEEAKASAGAATHGAPC